jgi:hypothetical protein
VTIERLQTTGGHHPKLRENLQQPVLRCLVRRIRDVPVPDRPPRSDCEQSVPGSHRPVWCRIRGGATHMNDQRTRAIDVEDPQVLQQSALDWRLQLSPDQTRPSTQCGIEAAGGFGITGLGCRSSRTHVGHHFGFTVCPRKLLFRDSDSRVVGCNQSMVTRGERCAC